MSPRFIAKSLKYAALSFILMVAGANKVQTKEPPYVFYNFMILHNLLRKSLLMNFDSECINEKIPYKLLMLSFQWDICCHTYKWTRYLFGFFLPKLIEAQTKNMVNTIMTITCKGLDLGFSCGLIAYVYLANVCGWAKPAQFIAIRAELPVFQIYRPFYFLSKHTWATIKQS